VRILEGKIIKNYNGFYYVEVDNDKVYSCKVKGKLKKNRFSLCTGDFVLFEYDEKHNGESMITEILPRKNYLSRPIVANIDLIVVATSCVDPNFSYLLTDKLLALAEIAKIPVIIILNKVDLAKEDFLTKCKATYESIGYKVFPISVKNKIGIVELERELHGKTTAFAGTSGVGKSSTINAIEPGLKLKTGIVSEKIGRGKHTTRYAELLPFAKGYLVDTPGFGNLSLEDIDAVELRKAFIEFRKYSNECKFNTCTHTHEPKCEVKAALERGEISRSRYESYLTILEEIKTKKERDDRKW
jgi:ribosome biogenesis GTPase